MRKDSKKFCFLCFFFIILTLWQDFWNFSLLFFGSYWLWWNQFFVFGVNSGASNFVWGVLLTCPCDVPQRHFILTLGLLRSELLNSHPIPKSCKLSWVMKVEFVQSYRSCFTLDRFNSTYFVSVLLPICTAVVLSFILCILTQQRHALMVRKVW